MISTAPKVGKYTYGTENIRTKWGNYYEIGAFCSIAENVTFFNGGYHHSEWITTYPFGHIYKNVFNLHDGHGHPHSHGSVIIGNDVWIAANVTIMSGVKVGDGAIIANNSHVVKDVEPYTMVGGNPARLIKKRFSDEIIEALLRIQWWNWSDEKINKYTPLLCSGDVEKFIKEATIDS